MYPIAILCGGKGTRLGLDKPKCLAEIGGRPFIEWQIEMLVRRGFDKIVLCAGHRGEEVWKALRGWHPGATLHYSFDGSTPLGTGGALKHALHLLTKKFWFTYGDTYLDIDYAAVEKSFNAWGLLTVLHNQNQWDMSNVRVRGDSVIAYGKPQVGSDFTYIDAGAGILSLSDVEEQPSVWDLELLFQELIAEDELQAYEAVQRFYHIGTPTALAETRAYLEGLYA